MASPDELFPLVDENGNVIGSVRRKDAHGNPSLIHPVVHCLVISSGGELLLQLRRMDKDVQPGRWDTSVGGHVAWGEPIEQALHRELQEEIGLEPTRVSLRFLHRYLMRSDIETELVHTWACTCDGPFVHQPEEIDALRFWSVEQIEQSLGSGVFTPNFEDEFARFKTARRT